MSIAKYWGITILGLCALVLCFFVSDCLNGTTFEEDAIAVNQVFIPVRTDCRLVSDGKGGTNSTCTTHPAHWRITVEMQDGSLQDIQSNHGIVPGRRVQVRYHEGRYTHIHYGEQLK